MQVVVTGATSDIGAATVKINGGKTVFAVVRPCLSNHEASEELAGGDLSGLVTICPLDLADIRRCTAGRCLGPHWLTARQRQTAIKRDVQ